MTDTNHLPGAQRAASTINTPTASGSPETAHAVATVIAAIRAAVAADASVEARAVGATACRTILTALEAQAGQPLAPPPAATSPSSPLAAMLSQLASMPREQLIEFLVGRLRTALPPGTATQATAGPRFPLIQIPPALPVRTQGGAS
jgi:hypothetical protein